LRVRSRSIEMENDFYINLEGLKEGNHEFQYQLNKTFFQSIDYAEIENGNFNVGLRLNKSSRHFELKFTFKGEVEVICDHCADEFLHPMLFFTETIIRFGEEEYEDDDLIVLEKNNPVFDVKHYIYESIFINLPLKLVHPSINGVSGCNPETLKKLEELKQNKENEKESDPRWDALKKLNK
jgi:uncharacterized metal-binding protein YceD (DUF177 family)